MDAREFEQILRKVVREELAALLAAQSPAPPEPPRPEVEPVEGVHPYALSDRELEQAERLLPEEERPILRNRVMAYRLEQMGKHASAGRMRKRAETLEKRLAS